MIDNHNIMDSREIRQTFKDFFASKEHEIVASAPMVVKNDPTLMFTNRITSYNVCYTKLLRRPNNL